ncbi:MAG: prolyl oligopeptidase family serine peptidase [Bryobacteraceae bacterium]|nr:prolyl oligopeptidase family serine peptidase [Bryobacteraceae bacterium]MDW8376843.1 prolyl oligopeptidase family serine peptidase [Bryobacterales bacterium]
MQAARLWILCFLAADFLKAAAKWTVDDILLAETVSQARLSRDGKLLVYVKSQMDVEKGVSISNLYLRNLAEDFEVQLTRGKDNHASPQFSPDGRRIAFLSSRKPSDSASETGPAGEPRTGMQVWMIDTRGGEAYAVTKFEKGVRGFGWLDNDSLLLLAEEDASWHEQQLKERKDTSQVVEDERHAAAVRLFRFNLKSRQSSRLTNNNDRISRVSVSPNGTWAVTVHDQSLSYVWDQTVPPVTYLQDLKNGSSKQLFAGQRLLPRQIEWRMDEKAFYFSAPYSSHPRYLHASIEKLYQYEVATGQTTEIALDWERGLGPGIAVTADGFLAALADGVRPKLARYRWVNGAWRREFLQGEHVSNIFSLELAGDQLVYRYSTASTPDQWYAAKLNGAVIEAPKQIITLNSSWKKKPIARSEIIRWKGAKDEEVEGLLYYPHNFQPGTKYPLVVMIHGGPHGADFDLFADRWTYPVQLFAQRGAFILKPNYHGSSNYGLKWGESISGGNYNELEWIDVETGVDSLIARGLVDREKLGVMGWSNGSIITIELTTRTTRYRAASAGAGDVNWISDWGNCEFGHSFDDYYLGKTPLEDPQLYIKKSPLFRMDRVRTPTIIFFGTEDRQVPTEQGWQHYRALKHLGKTDVRFILFPGEAHGPRKYVHQRRKVEEELAWFDKYLFGAPADSNEFLRQESPLSALLKRRLLSEIPDTVARGDIEIGRFEVTRAQFRAFDPSYPVAPGAEQYPANGISFEQAKKYCEWLSAKTGKKYRLGTEEELGPLLAARKEENTLDHWAGYTVNPDDAIRLASLLESLGPGALLKPVGSFPGTGQEPAFDLGGNVAEWVVGADGTGKVLGGSADRPADAKSGLRPRPDYTGFRVVREP